MSSPPFSYLIAFCFIYISISVSQECLRSPEPLDWTYSNGIYSGELVFDSAEFTVNEVTFTTRVHNGVFPSPTLFMKAGKTYKLRLVNNLEYEAPNNTMHIIKEPNYSNIHTHGLHISGESPADNIFIPVIPGGNFIEYTYNMPCDHSGGTFWYHPHHHGSTTIQVGGGAAGALIVDHNDKELLSFPNWYKSLTSTELILMIQHLDLTQMASYQYIDNVFKTTSNTSFYAVNGKYKPTICLKTNIWRKLRMVHVDVARPVMLSVESDSCSIYLLSKDGVLIHGLNNEVPRYIPSNMMYFTVSSRADIAIQCSNPGIYTLNAENRSIAYIEVSGPYKKPVELTRFNPFRPKYLQSLLNFNGVYNSENIHLDGRKINGERFSGSTNYQFTLSAGSMNEWNVTGSDVHPFHPHINHFQLYSFDEQRFDDIPGPFGWTEIGDWIDTLGFNASVRFNADRFGGRMVLHCHRLRHEDEGQMAVILIDGGCDWTGFANFGTGEPKCDYSCCDDDEQQLFVEKAVSVIQPNKYMVRGTVIFIDQIEPVHPTRIYGEISGLKKYSKFGVSIHENNCLSIGNLYIGDLVNIWSDKYGVATFDIFDSMIYLNGDESVIGRSFVIHEFKDNSKPVPIGCGVIGIAKENML